LSKVRYMDEEILKMQITVNSKLVNMILKELNISFIRPTSPGKANT
jgi:hypothetical protein